MASQSNGAWQLTLYGYDADGRLTTRHTFTEAEGGSILTALNTTVAYVRDRQGTPTERRLTVGTQTFNHWYDYDGRGLLAEVYSTTSSTKSALPSVVYTYGPGGEVESRQFAYGPAVPMRYTIRGQLARIGDPTSTSYPFSARYAYHPNATVSESEFYSAGSPVSPRYRYTFGTSSYDALNRLRSADYSSWNGSWATSAAHDLTAITYDDSGNLLTLQRYGNQGTLVDNLSYSYASTSNRLGSVSDAVSTTTEDWDAEDGSFSYDANGNLKSAPAPYALTAATYDHRNLPLSLTSGGVSTTYRYDHTGQRITKRVGTGATEVYLLEGATPLAVFTVDAAGLPTAWHFNVIAGGQVVGRAPHTGGRRYYHTDLLGSTRAVVAGTSVLESYDYDPWGVLMPGRTLAGNTKEGFTGKERDAESGLDYFGARLYMPALGRWTSADPMADEYPSWSPYNYVLNNPLVLVDPDGRDVRCRRREDCQRAAAELNAIHDGKTNITVVETQWEVKQPWWKFWAEPETVNGYRLSTDESDFDWSEENGKYTAALYDVINSTDVTFNLWMVPPDFIIPQTRGRGTAGRMQGRNFSKRGGGTVYVGTSNDAAEPVGVILMHELVGHGHPAGGNRALDVNDHYQRLLQYRRRFPRPYSPIHGGYDPIIGWRETGLYRP